MDLRALAVIKVLASETKRIYGSVQGPRIRRPAERRAILPGSPRQRVKPSLSSSPSTTAEASGTGTQGPVTRRLRKFLELSPEDRVLFLKLWSLLPFVAASLRLLGYPRILRLLSRWSPAAPVQDKISEDSKSYALRLGQLARMAGRYVPTNGSCLRQSLLIWWLLRREGVPAELRIGVRALEGFTAHAWVEVGGQPVNDAPDVAERFAPFDGSLSTRLVSSP